MAVVQDRQALEREAEYRRCKGSSPKDYGACLHFLETHWKIQHPERGAILFELRDAQRETLEIWLRDRQSITLKARQIGFSTLVIGLAFWLALFWPDKFVIGLSRTERDAAKLLKKGDYGFKRLPEWLRRRCPRVLAKTLSKIEFSNGSVIESLPATDPARGESAYLIIVDEWAFFEKPEEAWAAIEPAIDIGGRVITLSTANGYGNLYHEMWVGAETGSNDFTPIFYSWRAVPERNDAWYEAKRRSMRSWQLHQEYPTTPEEAFIKSGNPVFDVDALMALPTAAPRRGALVAISDSDRHVEFRPSEDGPLCVWELPQHGTMYVIGADVAEGLEHGDYSVAHVINTKTGLVAAKWRGHIEADLFGKVTLKHLGYWYGGALVGPECNSIGTVTCMALRDCDYPNLYYRTSYDERTLKEHRKLGWRTQQNTKGMMIVELAAALRPEESVNAAGDDDVTHGELILMDAETIAELRTYVREGDGKMHGSPFDDQTISLAIANQMRKHAWTMDDFTERSDYMTFGALMRELQEEDRTGGTFFAGAHNRR